ncbi:MAG: type II CAAX endopeptidase family protein [bacterium]|nr:type II CAAX endopeptidase family protein [bacterium]
MKRKEFICLVPMPFLLSILMQAAIAAMMNMLHMSDWFSNGATYSAFSRLVTGFSYVICFGCWYYYVFGRNRRISYKRIFTVNHIFLLLAIAICGQVTISFLLTMVLPLIAGAAEHYQATVGTLFEMSPLTLLYVVILSPLGEECIFRGLTLQFGRRAMPALLANMIQAVLFGLYHWNLVQGIYAFVMGFVFGFVVIKLGSLWTAIIMHVVLNAVGLWMNACLNPDLSAVTGIVICLFSLAIVGLSLYLLPTLKPEVME